MGRTAAEVTRWLPSALLLGSGHCGGFLGVFFAPAKAFVGLMKMLSGFQKRFEGQITLSYCFVYCAFQNLPLADVFAYISFDVFHQFEASKKLFEND